jgi:HD superfamily phosphodiesterase
MHSGDVGSWSWAERTGGKLSRADRRALLNQALRFQWRRVAGRVARRFGQKHAAVVMESLRVPDSPTALRAAELCAQLSPLWLTHHCTRTYLWGCALGLRASLSYDEEFLYIAAMLHDLGLTPDHWGKDATAQCFGVEGARAAKAFAREAGWDARRQDALAEAICLHLNVVVPVRQGVEAHLLQAGASCDVIGAAYHAIAPKTRALVLEQYPRLDFKREITNTLRQQVLLRPDARAALLAHNLQFGERIARAPFAE